MKQLICAADVEALKQAGKTECLIGADTIVTPSARDAADLLGISFVEKSARTKQNCDGQGLDSEQIYRVLKILMDKGLLDGLLEPKSFQSERHTNGLTVVHGDTVKMVPLETDNPAAKVCYQELIREPRFSAGFMEIDHSDFHWDHEEPEAFYVIEGPLCMTIDEKTYTANAGDVLYIPSGSKVTWEAPAKAKVFYIEYSMSEAEAR